MGLIHNFGDGEQSEQYPSVVWEAEIELCRRSVEVINRMRPRPKFVIVCGDLVDAMPQVSTEAEETDKCHGCFSHMKN